MLKRAPELGEVGAGLSIAPNALRAFGPPHDTPLSCFHRADLHRLLATELPDGVVRTGCAVRSVTPDSIHSAVREALWPGIAPRLHCPV